MNKQQMLFSTYIIEKRLNEKLDIALEGRKLNFSSFDSQVDAYYQGQIDLLGDIAELFGADLKPHDE